VERAWSIGGQGRPAAREAQQTARWSQRYQSLEGEFPMNMASCSNLPLSAIQFSQENQPTFCTMQMLKSRLERSWELTP